LRELWAVLRRVWWNLTLFAGLIVAAALLLQAYGCYPDAPFHEQLANALYLTRLESLSGSRGHLLPSVLAFVMPVLAVVILGEGAVRVMAIYLGRGRHREEWERIMASTLSGHVVLCGAGELGRALLAELFRRDSKAEVVVIDTRPAILAELGMQASSLHHVHGDMTTGETLVAANVQKASVVLVASGDDARNLEAAFRVLRLNPQAELWVRLYRIGLSDMMDTATRPNVHFFSPYSRAAEALAEELGRKT